MKDLERLAIKYLLIGFVVGILNYLATISIFSISEIFGLTNTKNTMDIANIIMSYTSNILVGLFILFDSIKYTKNKYIISILGFLIPVFGVCFLLIEKYLIQNTSPHE